MFVKIQNGAIAARQLGGAATLNGTAVTVWDGKYLLARSREAVEYWPNV